MATPYPIPGLTRAQRRVWEQIASNNDGGHHPRTLATLLAKGVIIRGQDRIVGRDRLGVITVPTYSVPINLHMKWCYWCSGRKQA